MLFDPFHSKCAVVSVARIHCTKDLSFLHGIFMLPHKKWSLFIEGF